MTDKPSVIPGAGDDRVYIKIGPLQIPGHGEVTLRVPRFGSLDIDTFDAMFADLEELDVEAQLVAVANDLAENPIGEKLVWDPLLKQAKRKLAEAGVQVKRVNVAGRLQDEVVCPSEDVLERLSEWSEQPVLSLPKRSREVVLTMLKHVLPEDDIEIYAKCTVDQMNFIRSEWESKSQLTLGEFLASESS